MIDENKYESLLEKLDLQISKLQSFSPEKVPGLAEIPLSVGFNITNETDVNDIPDDKVVLVHSLLHMFYHNKSGAKLNKKTIERLHKELKPRMKKHSKFDKLDD